MICRVIDSPSPVPCGLVVKNGSNSRSAISVVMPPPVSDTAISTASSPRWLSIVRAPPRESASMPFFTRLWTAWRSRPRSISISGTAASVATWIVSPWRTATGRTKAASSSMRWLIDSSSKCGLGKRAKARYSSVSASSVLTWSRMAATSPVASSMSAPGWPRTMSCSISAFSSMAAIGLRTS